MGGKEIQRYAIRGIKGYICKDFVDNKSNIETNSILLQRIISHIQNPTPHIKFTATIAPNGDKRQIVNTIFQIICKENISNKYILGLLHSKLINWYCYRFCFSKAIRSMDFSNEIANKIPLPKITEQNQSIADSIITLVEEILNLKAKDSTTDTLHLESEIDNLVYKLYNLTEAEIKIIES